MKPKILIIEDEIRLAQLWNMELKHEGYETEIALDGATGLEKIRTREFSAVLLDFMLPKMSGLEVCRQTRSFSNVPIIALTAREDACKKMMDAGASRSFVKPVAIQEIFACLKELFPAET